MFQPGIDAHDGFDKSAVTERLALPFAKLVIGVEAARFGGWRDWREGLENKIARCQKCQKVSKQSRFEPRVQKGVIGFEW